MLESWGTGRFDYTSDTSVQAHPIIRAGQGFYAYHTSVIVPASSSVSFSVPIEQGKNIVIFDAYVSTYKNVLIGLTYTTGNTPVLYKADYQAIKLLFNAGLCFSSLTVTLTNYDSEDHRLYYSHHGLLGTQKVVSIQE